MSALASRFYEDKANDLFDGTLSGFWNVAVNPMLDHFDAWDGNDVVAARDRAGWLAEIYGCGRPAEAAAIGDGEEGAKLSKIESHQQSVWLLPQDGKL